MSRGHLAPSPFVEHRGAAARHASVCRRALLRARVGGEQAQTALYSIKPTKMQMRSIDAWMRVGLHLTDALRFVAVDTARGR